MFLFLNLKYLMLIMSFDLSDLCHLKFTIYQLADKLPILLTNNLYYIVYLSRTQTRAEGRI